MAGPLITDELWHELVPHLDGRAKGLRRGRPLTSDRATITGILFVLKTGIAWKDLPRELNCGSGMTCLRRLRGWQRIGVWERMCEVLRRPGFGLERLDWARVEVRRQRRDPLAASFVDPAVRGVGGSENTSSPRPGCMGVGGACEHVDCSDGPK